MFAQRLFVGVALAASIAVGGLVPVSPASAQTGELAIEDAPERGIVVPAGELTVEEVPDHQIVEPIGDKVIGVNPHIDSLWLVDADADTVIGEISDGQVFDRDLLPPNLSIIAEANGDTESVQFGYGGVIATRIENLEPYAIGGDNAGNYAAFDLPDGWHTVRARPFAADNASGSFGNEVLLSFGIFQETIVVDTTTDGHDDDPGDGVCLSSPGGAIDDVVAKTPTGDAPARPADKVTSAPSRAGAQPQQALATEGGRNPDSRGQALLAGKCTLRAAIEEANARVGRQRIEVPHLGVYTTPLGTLVVTDTVEIAGGGQPTIDALDMHRNMHIVDAGEVFLSSLRFLNGDIRSNGQSGNGGNLMIDNSSVEIVDSEIRNGLATNGGGIYVNEGELTLRESIVAGNGAGDPNHDDGNIGGVNQWGGGIYSRQSDIVIDTSSIHNNTAVRGAGITIAGGFESFITNSAIIENTAFQQGAGLAMRTSDGDEARVHIAWTTIAYNSGVFGATNNHLASGGGLWVYAGELIMGNSVVADNTVAVSQFNEEFGPDCWVNDTASFISYRGNIVSQVTDACGMVDSHFGAALPHDLVGDADQPFDADLGTVSLSWRPSVLPLVGSAAVDHGPNNAALAFFGPCPDTDVRGRPRPADDSLCDIGSAERQ